VLFDGSFKRDSTTFHIISIKDYQRTQRPGQDINIVSPLSRETQHRASQLMIFKDVDDEHYHEPHLKPTALPADHGCAFDSSMSRESFDVGVSRLEKRADLPDSCFGDTKRILQMVCVFKLIISRALQLIARTRRILGVLKIL
jgi:hypothetical protein